MKNRVCVIKKMISELLICSQIFLLLWTKLFISIFYLIAVTFGAVTIWIRHSFNQLRPVFVPCVCSEFPKGQKLCKGGMW